MKKLQPLTRRFRQLSRLRIVRLQLASKVIAKLKVNRRKTSAPHISLIRLFCCMMNVWKTKVMSLTYDYATNARNSYTRHLQKHTAVKDIKCDQCAYATHSKGNLNQHLRTHQNEKKFKCGQCTFETHVETYLKRHALNHKPTTDFKCSYCPYATNVKVNFNKHLSKHTRESLRCEQCDYVTRDRENLRRHLLKHVELKDFKCKFERTTRST
ncbi:RE1-silencing transcription factor B-like [Photinus pyralis]|uniref:RE1-silencing transcription factor B-like n=1 Tax=Photinus pyralis TaxID=7054 RepID=UPI0012675535|nr:RE1-silencing transcription factor B-like [Photinus pyralis]XP_031356766.1 RE1-silencing transcription factor B-like [Photinus pyralis]